MSVAWFDGVTITVEVAFTTAPLASSPSWTDVSAYVRGIEIDRGRSDEFSKFGPGTCAVTFSNRDRRFDPEYAAGSYFGNLNPMKKIRVRATYSATTYDLFVGFVQGWPQDYKWTFDSTVTVKCVDGSRILESSTLNRSAYEAAVVADSPVAYWPMQEQNVTSSASYAETIGGRDAYFIPSASSTLPAITAPTVTTISQLIEVDSAVQLDTNYDAFGGSVTATAGVTDRMPSEPLGLEMWFRPNLDGANNSSISVRAAQSGGLSSYIRVSVSSVGALRLEFSNAADDVTWSTSADVLTTISTERFSHIAAWYNGSTTVTIYVNGTAAATATVSAGAAADVTTATGLVMGPGEFAHVAVYTGSVEPSWSTHYFAGISAYGHPYGERTGARVGRVLDEIGWPSADRTLSTGDTVHGPYIPDRQSAMGYMQDAETAEDGYLFIGKNGNVILRDRNWQWTQASVGTFSDDGSDIPYEAITIDANSLEPLRTAVSVTYGPNDAYLKVEDSTAKTAYGPALEALSTPTLDSSLTARSLAQYRLRAWKDPATRITELTVQPRAKAATAYPVVLALELGDRITVERTPGNPVIGSQIVKSLTVQGISHSIDVDGTWLTTLYLSPAPALGTAVPYLIVGDATYGRIGAAAGNKIPF